MAQYSVPGVAVALTQARDIRWASGFGETGAEGQDVTPQTVFQVASLGKPVFAHLVERQATEGSLSLGVSLEAWHPEGHYPPEYARLSVDDLLGHTAGLKYDQVTDRVSVVPEVGDEWAYSGAGYALLQRAFEGVEGMGLGEASDALLFEPLELASMSYVVPSGSAVAVGHDRNGNPVPGMDWSEANAGSSLHSNATDYARFMVRVARPGEEVPQHWELLTQPQAAVRDDIGLYWGLGWALEQDSDGAFTAFHWGSNPGFKSFALFDRTRGMGIVVLTNGDNGLELIQHALAILDAKPHRLFEFYMLHPDD